MKQKTLPIGIDNFEELVSRNAYYVDKTNLIAKLIESTTKVSLFTRPRRFGKSLNLSMIKTYFEKCEEDKSYLFEGLHITELDNSYQSHQGTYPVIMLNYKEGKQENFEESYYYLTQNIMSEYLRHGHIAKSDKLTKSEVQRFLKIQNGEVGKKEFIGSIQFLCSCLEKVYNRKVIILIDEYDVPLENAYFRGFYQEMITFIRGMLSIALKTNDSLYFAVMTGCLRITKESIFTGLNNLRIVSIENKEYGEYFGFTNEEVLQMLKYYGKEHHVETIKEWYNGYLFGSTEVYNPWSLINYMELILVDDKEFPKPHWSNTSSNSIVKDLVEKADANTKMELEVLSAGGTIEKPIHEDVTYQEIYQSSDNLWNFLYFTGYLKKVSERFECEQVYATLKIPNVEVASIYRNHIMEWTKRKVSSKDRSTLFEATLISDTKVMEEEIKKALRESISFYDSGEAFYHGFMTALYQGMEDYIALSNREFGLGRPDFVLIEPNNEGKAYIFEFKVAKSPKELEQVTEEALNQIDKMDYESGLEELGYTEFIKIGVGFFRKNCKIKF